MRCPADSAWLTAVSAMGSASRRSNPICAAPACRTEGTIPVPNGGSARGYQAMVVLSTALTSPSYDGQPAVYLYIAALEVNVLNCRVEGCPGPSSTSCTLATQSGGWHPHRPLPGGHRTTRGPGRRSRPRRGCRSGQIPLEDPGKRRAEIARMMDTAGTGSPADTAELAQHRPSRHWRGL